MRLFADPIQQRTTRREPGAVYAAVLVLRREGHRVYRCGRNCHLVNGERMGNERLFAFAIAAGDLPDDYFEGDYWD